ncbi:MAG: hypothetical protein ABJC13_24685, partial [Acidobacteriota bacterium]
SSSSALEAAEIAPTAELELGAPRRSPSAEFLPQLRRQVRQFLPPPPVAMLLEQPPRFLKRRTVAEQPRPQ